MQGVEVPYEEAEHKRNELLEENILLTCYKPIKKESTIVFPVSEGTKGFRFERYKEKNTFQEEVVSFLTEEEKKVFIKSYDTIGDIAIVQIPTELIHKEKRIGEALLRVKPSLTCVRKRGEEHQGKYRTQNTVFLAGSNKTITTHTENRTKLLVDVNNVYYSPRLATERKRISELIEKDEDVLVLFDGCGPYSVTIANNNASCMVTGVEWNEKGVMLAKKSSQKNNVKDRTQYIKSDVEDIQEDIGFFDRIVMPAPHNAEEYLHVLKSVTKKCSYVHLYTFVDNEEMEKKGQRLKKSLSTLFSSVSLTHHEVCGQKSPGVSRVCYDFSIRT